MALEASSGSQDKEEVDWDAPLSMNVPSSTERRAHDSPSVSSTAAGVTSKHIAQDALSLAEDAAAVRHGKCKSFLSSVMAIFRQSSQLFQSFGSPVACAEVGRSQRLLQISWQATVYGAPDIRPTQMARIVISWWHYGRSLRRKFGWREGSLACLFCCNFQLHTASQEFLQANTVPAL